MIGKDGSVPTRNRPTSLLSGNPAKYLQLEQWRSWLPGLGVVAMITVISVVVNQAVPVVSALLVAIIAGAVLGNLRPVPPRWRPGLSVASRRLLRLGVILLGLQISVAALGSLGWQRLVLVVVVVGWGMAGTLLAGRLLGIPFALTALVACGFSICGAAAVAGAKEVVDADEEQTGTALMLVVLFGTLSIPVVPALSTMLALSTSQAATWAGASIHEVAQVVAAAAVIGPDAMAVAVVVKLARVVCLAAVMAALGLVIRRAAGTTDADAHHGARRRPALVPGFVIGFIAMVVVATVFPLDARVLAVAKTVQTGALAMAMAALGFGIQLRDVRRVGLRPVLLGVIATALVSVVSLIGVHLIG